MTTRRDHAQAVVVGELEWLLGPLGERRGKGKLRPFPFWTWSQDPLALAVGLILLLTRLGGLRWISASPAARPARTASSGFHPGAVGL